jgi:hypothetical protein
MYWVFNAYFISIRLAANNLTPASNQLSTSKVSAFFSKFKDIFQTISHIPQIGIICEAISAVMTFYLAEEAKTVNEVLNRLIAKNYYIEKDLETALEEALVNLAHSTYVESELSESKQSQISTEMNPFHRAYSWFKGKKKDLLEKMTQLQSKTSQ